MELLSVPIIRTSNMPSLDTRSERTGGPNFDSHVSHDFFQPLISFKEYFETKFSMPPKIFGIYMKNEITRIS